MNLSNVQAVMGRINRVITAIVAQCNAEAVGYKAKIVEISAEATVLRETVAELTEALAAASEENKSLIARATAEAQALDEATTALEVQYNVTPGTDAAAVAVSQEASVETPAIIEATEIVPAVETPIEIAESAIAAVVESVEAIEAA